MERKNKSVLDTFFILSLFIVLLITGIFTVIFGAKIYDKAENTMESNFELRTANLYIRNKIMAHDHIGGVYFDGNMLTLKSDNPGSKVNTYLYLKDGYLQEMTAIDTFQFDYQDGTRIMPMEYFKVEKSGDNMLHLFVISDEISTDFYVAVYSGIRE